MSLLRLALFRSSRVVRSRDRLFRGAPRDRSRVEFVVTDVWSTVLGSCPRWQNGKSCAPGKRSGDPGRWRLTAYIVTLSNNKTR